MNLKSDKIYGYSIYMYETCDALSQFRQSATKQNPQSLHTVRRAYSHLQGLKRVGMSKH